MDDETTIDRPQGPEYHLLPIGVQEDAARTFFRKQHGGAEPLTVKVTGGGTLVGPVPDAYAEARKVGAR